jgi:hypothetical protein
VTPFPMDDPTETDAYREERERSAAMGVPIDKREAYQIALGDLAAYDRKRIAMRMIRDMNRLYDEQDKEDETK